MVKVGLQQVMDHRMMTGSGKSKENLKSFIFYVNPKRSNQNTTIDMFFVQYFLIKIRFVGLYSQDSYLEVIVVVRCLTLFPDPRIIQKHPNLIKVIINY